MVLAHAPQVILIPEAAPARLRFAPRAPSYELWLAPIAKKSAPPTYRAIRDEKGDLEFARLAETAYLITR